MPMDKSLRGFTSAALSLNRKDNDSDVLDKKMKVIKDVVKKKNRKGPDNYDPDPEIEEEDTLVKT